MLKIYLFSDDINHLSNIQEALTKSVSETEALISPLIKNIGEDKAYTTISIGKENDCNAVIGIESVEYYMEFYGEIKNNMMGLFDKQSEDYLRRNNQCLD